MAIVGAGLGGLSAAIAILRAQCDVSVYEQAPTLGEVGAGVNLTPNVLCALRRLGLDQAVLERAFRPEHHVFRSWKSGRPLFRTRVKGEYERHFGAPVCNVHRADLHDVLRNALPAGIVRLNARCVRIEQSDESAVLFFGDGRQAEADVVIGADGIRSAVRQSLFGPDAPRYTGNVAWRFTVPTSSLPQGFVQPDITNWLGPGGHVVHYYVRRGALVNVVAVHESETWTEESWVLRGKREELMQAYAGWNDALLRLFDHAHECFKWGLFDRDPLMRWSQGRVTLMGDAAHPMLPFLGQGAAMAIEDGVALGILLAAHQSRDARDLLKAYETLRLERTARAQIGSRLRAKENHLRSPLARLRRDIGFRVRQWLKPHATLHAAEWLYSYDVTRASLDSLKAALLAIALVCVPGQSALARDYPASTVRMLVPVAPGGPLDLTARLLAEHFSATWKQPVIVENRPGSATLLATRAVAQAEPNGYTLLLASSSLSSYSAFFKDPRVDMRKDLAFVSLVARVPMFLAVSATEKLGSVTDLVALAKAKPGHLNYATYGNANRVMTELFNRALEIQVTHIGYPGAAPAAQALMRGDVAYMLDSMSTLQPLIAGGKVKVLAVTEPSRVSAFPSTPTLKEAGYAMPDFSVWYGLVAPAGTASDITDRLSREVAVFSKSPRARTSLEGLGFSLTSSTPEEFRQTVLKGEAVFQEISRSLGIQPE